MQEFDNTNMKLIRGLHTAVSRNIKAIEMTGVLMRIFSFSLTDMAMMPPLVMKPPCPFPSPHPSPASGRGGVSRFACFTLISWLGPASPFLFVWAFNTIDAIMLSWCAIIKNDKAYTILNVFWIGVGIVGIIRAHHVGVRS